MKFLVILSLVAFVACEPESEAKPESESWYGFNYPSFYRGYAGYPYYNHQSAYPTTYNHAMTARFVQPYNGHFVNHTDTSNVKLKLTLRPTVRLMLNLGIM